MMEVSYRELYQIIRENGFKDWSEFKCFISNFYKIEILNEECVRVFFKNFKKRWQDSKRTAERFEESNQSWLNIIMTLKPKEETSPALPSSSLAPQEPSIPSYGRPSKPLDQCSEVSKRRKLKEHNENLSTDMVKQALCQRYKTEKCHQKASIVEAVDKASPIRVARIKNSISTPKDLPRKLAADEALSLFLDLGLSKEKYNVLRRELKKRNHDALPSYKKISEAKKLCIPDLDEVTNSMASVSLQKLLDCTAKRILEIKSKDEIEALDDTDFEMVSKWGCDGSSGQSEYKQKLSEGNNTNITDANMFITSLVPLRLKCLNSESLLWKNPRPSSSHFCRPIKFQYIKETKEVIKNEVELIKNQINLLVPTKCSVFGKEITVSHTLHLTMVDGKVIQHVTDTKSSSTCIICQKNPKDFEIINESCDIVENYQYGLSPLHARIRFMEFTLHLSYDLSFSNEGVRNHPENKQKRQEEKLRIQNEFRNKLGLIVDTPKQGFGNTNDGNTARRFFEDPNITAEITKVNVEILQHFKTILNVLSCGLPTNAEKFGAYAENAEKLLFEKYPNRNLTPTVHKVLRHGKRIIQHHLLPIGEMSEEAQEARNKDYKYYRYHNTRKTYRDEQNRDLMNILLLSSDPYISSIRNIRSKRDVVKTYPEEMVNLLNIDEDVDNTFTRILT